jgi:hypothetical protein
VIVQKYLDMLQQLNVENLEGGPDPTRFGGIEAEPGFFARRRRNLRPASEIVAELPSGPVLN